MILSPPLGSFDMGYTKKISPATEVQSENILLDRIRGGDPAGFEQLVLQEAPRLVNLAYRLTGNRDDAEDIAQEAFLRLHRNLSSFRGESTLGTWLYRTVTHLAVDYLRRERLRRKIFFLSSREDEDLPDLAQSVPSPEASPRDYLLAREAGIRLNRSLRTLSPRQRAVFILRHQEGLPLKEIGRILGLEEGTVKVHLHRAVLVLRRELDDLRKDRP